MDELSKSEKWTLRDTSSNFTFEISRCSLTQISWINFFCIRGKIIQTGFNKRSKFFFCLTIIEENMVKFISCFYIACLIVVQYCWKCFSLSQFLTPTHWYGPGECDRYGCNLNWHTWNELCMMIFLLFIAFHQFLSIFIFCIFCHISFLFFILTSFFNICFCHMVILIGLNKFITSSPLIPTVLFK